MPLPINLLRNERKLVPAVLERCLRRSRLFSDGDQWSSEVISAGLSLDLSFVEYIDLGSITQLVVLVEAALRAGIRIAVVMPSGKATRAEAETLSRVAGQEREHYIRAALRRRQHARQFLNYLRVPEALQPTHMPDALHLLTIRESDDHDVPTIAASDVDNLPPGIDGAVAYTSSYEYKHCFPLTWISADAADNPERFAAFLSWVLSDDLRGMAPTDAKSLTNVILHELIDNVGKHARPATHALVAAWARPNSSPPRPDEHYPSQRPFMAWLAASDLPSLDIVVADSGPGLHAVLANAFHNAGRRGVRTHTINPRRDANILLWAWDRWSTSDANTKRRGTRGLYRVDRVVRMYQGLATVRSSRELVGWDHGGAAYDNPIGESDALSHIPGTQVRLHIPALPVRVPHWRESPRATHDIAFHYVQLDGLTAAGFSEEDYSRLEASLEVHSGERRVCLVVSCSAIGDHTGVDTALRRAVEICHPHAVVLYGLPGGWNIVDNAIDSLEHDRERSHFDIAERAPDQYEVWSPLLVLGSSGEAAWAGASPALASVLTNLLASPNNALSAEDLCSIVPDADALQAALRRLRSYILVKMLPTGGLALQVSPQAVVNGIRSTLATHIERHGNGVSAEGLYRTPSLQLTSQWIDVSAVLAATVGDRLAAFALARVLTEAGVLPNTNAPTAILCEAAADRGTARELARCLGVTRFEIFADNIALGLPYGLHLVDKGSHVVIFTSIVLSGESARRCLKQVFRDGARPIAVACIFDGRSDPREPLTWLGIPVPVISLATVNLRPGRVNAAAVINIGPAGDYERPERDRHLYRISPDNLIAKLEQARCVTLSHVGKGIERHFTLTFDPRSLLADGDIIQAFQDEIQTWRREVSDRIRGDLEPIEIWFPRTGHRGRDGLAELAGTLSETLEGVVETRSVRRDFASGRWHLASGGVSHLLSRSVAIVDWGAVRGTTSARMLQLALEAGASHVCVVVLACQLDRIQESFLRSLERMRGLRQDLHTPDPLLPFIDPSAEVSRVTPDLTTSCGVSVRFLSRVPFNGYDASDCPVCQQVLDIHRADAPTDYLAKAASAKADKRLAVRPWQDTDASGITLEGDEASPSNLAWILRFRSLLLDSQTRTSSRELVASQLSTITATWHGTPDTDLRVGLVLFLSVEQDWLRYPPLHNEVLRETIADICISLALDDSARECDRYRAIGVLRSTSKTRFVKSVADLGRASSASSLMLEQLLLCCHTFLARDYHRQTALVAELKSQLAQLSHVMTSNPSAVTQAAADTVDRMGYRALILMSESLMAKYTPYRRWCHLREELPVGERGRHGDVVTAIHNLMPGPYEDKISSSLRARDGGHADGGFPKEVDDWLRTLVSSWNRCAGFLDHVVLPACKAIQHSLHTSECKRILGPDVAAKLLDMVEDPTPIAEGKVSHFVKRLGVDGTSTITRQEWDAYKSEVQWLWDAVKPDSATTQSRLSQLMSSVPVSLGPALQAAWHSVPRDVVTDRDGTIQDLFTIKSEVFCTPTTLSRALEELLSNLRKHRLDGSRPVSCSLAVAIEDNHAMVTFTNDNTAAATHPGFGLASVRAQLQAFGGALDTSTRPVQSWATFEATLTLELAK